MIQQYCMSRSCWRPVTSSVGGIDMCDRHRRLMRATFSDSGESVVYYIGDPAAQQIKIGTSGQLRTRMHSLRARRPSLVLLATEPGGVTQERQRHLEFAATRTTGEWFNRSPNLMAHINDLRGRYGLLQPGGPVPIEYLAPERAAS